MERHGASDRLHVLAYRHQGRECHRVLWGHYRSEDAARAEVTHLPPDLPPDLRSPDVRARRLAELAP